MTGEREKKRRAAWILAWLMLIAGCRDSKTSEPTEIERRGHELDKAVTDLGTAMEATERAYDDYDATFQRWRDSDKEDWIEQQDLGEAINEKREVRIAAHQEALAAHKRWKEAHVRYVEALDKE